MIVADVMNRVFREFGDEAKVQIDDTDIIRWINDGVKYITVSNNLLQATGTMNSVIDQSDYNFPTDMLSMEAMYYNNLKLKYMKHTEFNEYVNSSDPNQDQRGTPWMYTRWANQFTLYPKPNTSYTNGIKLLYLQRPADIASTSDTVPLSLEYHPEIVKYCLQRAYQTDEDWDAAGQMAGQFQDGVDRLKEQETNKDREYYDTITILQDDL